MLIRNKRLQIPLIISEDFNISEQNTQQEMSSLRGKILKAERKIYWAGR